MKVTCHENSLQPESFGRDQVLVEQVTGRWRIWRSHDDELGQVRGNGFLVTTIVRARQQARAFLDGRYHTGFFTGGMPYDPVATDDIAEILAELAGDEVVFRAGNDEIAAVAHDNSSMVRHSVEAVGCFPGGFLCLTQAPFPESGDARLLLPGQTPA